jgi:hypothetical protein
MMVGGRGSGGWVDNEVEGEMCDYKLLLTRKVLFDMTYVSQS